MASVSTVTNSPSSLDPELMLRMLGPEFDGEIADVGRTHDAH